MRLELLVKQLQGECDRLRQALAKAENERNTYRQLYVEHAAHEFEELDKPTLEAMSAGPIEMIK